MKAPSYCPFCKFPLVNSEKRTGRYSSKWNKACFKNLSHKISIQYNFDNDDVENIQIHFFNLLSSNFIADWSMINKTLFIEIKSGKLNIPYFEPDLTDYKKLGSKIQKYLVFL